MYMYKYMYTYMYIYIYIYSRPLEAFLRLPNRPTRRLRGVLILTVIYYIIVYSHV